MSEAIKVVVRIRPMNTKQNQRGCNSIVEVDQENNQIRLIKPDQASNTKSFAYDHVFGQDSAQQLVYSKTAYNLVENVILGYNGTIFAYGQTGCGKTHSMVGKVDSQQLQGIIPRSFGHILSSIGNAKDKQFLLRCSFIQIYNQQVRDLLSSDVKAKLQVKQSPQKGVFIKDLSMNPAKTHSQLMGYMNIGNKNRTVGQTAMNKDSSRSHLIFMLFLESAEISDSQDKKYMASKLNLVDLAGSQRLSKTGAAGDRLKQAQKINLSLSALGNVISALVDGKSQHIPYRDSKLTRLLQDSLGGNTKTVMIANCSPADYNYDQTLSTLRYASRAKFIKNKPIINQDPKDALLKQYAQQIKRLKMQIAVQNGDEKIVYPSISSHQQNGEMDEKLKQKQLQLTNQKQQKRRLQQKIKQLQKIHLLSNQVHVDKNIKKAFQRASIINKSNVSVKQDKKQQTIEQEQKKIQKGEDLVNTQQIKVKYKNLVKKLKQKVKNLQNQLKDINHENYMEKQIILEDVRGLNKENQLLEGIINMMLKPTEVQAIRQAAVYSQQKQQYRVPPFYLKSKQLILPKLNDNQSLELIKQMQQNRRLSWSNNKDQTQNAPRPPMKNIQNISSMSPSLDKIKQNVFKMEDNKKLALHDIIKDARKDTSKVTSLSSMASNPNILQKQNLRKLQLEPLKKEDY